MKISLENIQDALVRDEMRAISGGSGGSGTGQSYGGAYMAGGADMPSGGFGSSAGGSYSYLPPVVPSSTNSIWYAVQAASNIVVGVVNAGIFIINNSPAPTPYTPVIVKP